MSQSDAKNHRNVAKGAKGQLACQLWLHIYVMIVNRSIKTYYISYSEFITYDILLIFPQIFDIRKQYFKGDCPPTSAGLVVSLAKKEWLVEIDAIAVIE